MTSGNVIVLNFDDPNLKTKLATLPEKMADWAEEVLLEQARTMVALAQVYVDVDTGSLRDSIRVERGGQSLRWREVRVRAGGYIVNPKTNRIVNYAKFVEARHPFMLPAYLEVKDTIKMMITSRVVDKANE